MADEAEESMAEKAEDSMAKEAEVIKANEAEDSMAEVITSAAWISTLKCQLVKEENIQQLHSRDLNIVEIKLVLQSQKLRKFEL